MPELPEVEYARRQMHQALRDSPLEMVSILEDKFREQAGPNPILQPGAVLESSERRGKRVVWHFRTLQSQEVSLSLHLGMSGQLVVAHEAPKHSRFGLKSEKHQAVWMVDPRKFGTLWIGPREDLHRALKWDELGPDAMEIRAEEIRICAAKRKTPIKVLLMDQACIAGVGNIYAAEALFLAGIHPTTSSNVIKESDFDALAKTIPQAMQRSLDVLESQNELIYVNAGGENPFLIYDREGEPCPICKTPIKRIVQAARSTYFCSQCQPKRRARKTKKTPSGKTKSAK